jgi:hypothetical protein
MSTIKSSAENLTLNADGANNDIKFQSNGSEVAAIDQAGNLTVSGTVDGVDIQTLNTTAGAALPKAGGTMTGDIIFADGEGISLGAGVDLTLLSDGSTVKFQGDDMRFRSKDGTETYFDLAKNAGIGLRYDNSTKIATTSAGATVTGNLAVTGTVDGVDIQTLNTTASAALPKAGGAMTGTITNLRSTGIDDNANALAMTIDSSERIGVGTTSPQNPLEISGNTNYLMRITQTGTNKHMFKTVGNGASMDFLADGANNYVGFNSTTSGDDIRFQTNDGNERVRILAAGGLTFNGDSAAANALDDYEEGTWTIVMTGSSSGSGNVGTGHYTKIGRMVHCIVIIDNTTTPTFSGNMQVSLPFTGSSGNGNRNEGSGDVYFYPLSKWTTGSDFTGVTFQVYGNSPTHGFFSLKRTNTNRQSAVNSSQGSNSAQSGVYARFSITYTAS